MNTLISSPVVSRVQDSFLDSQGLEAVRSLGRKDDPAALKEMAKQFEALFVQQMMKSMRSANDVFAEGNYMRSSDTEFYQQMLDQQMSLELTKGRGLGLSEVLYQQMMRSYGDYFHKGQEPQNNTSVAPSPIQRTSQAEAVSQVQTDAHGVAGFIEKIKPYAKWAADQLGVNPAALVAQAALETGWGKSVAKTADGASSNNFFNIKTSKGWKGDSLEVNTTEYIEGEARPVKAEFRQYASLFESFADYVRLLQKPRYADAIAAGQNVEAFARGLQQAGYATDPVYADKIVTIAEREELIAAFSGGNS